ncbi:E3 ubiquitin-protein ligase TRIM39 isoform X2 [Hemibagrus wyckioides]|uniref:E3 ubiquitin-protein ligase TRIM39 isoform X2 n=1 Tax=Hemibagrus wyckioides TaxID=337641 RepID=UPI00266DB0FB|nr:E3 ubiquitin-protein ligase TRIM39 isoform X2 [Hemibagrus wyckioides]
MSIPVDFLSEEQFSCSICLDIFTNPVSTPCGHSFCLSCIMSYWDGRGKSCLCPLCKESFRKRPELHINHTLKEITEQFKRMAENSGSHGNSIAAQAASSQSPRMTDRKISGSPRPGELPGVLLKEMKSRFQRTSSSGNLLEASGPSSSPPPYEASRRRFSASGFGPASSNGPPCSKHGLSLDMFCRNDQICVCAMCGEGDHHGHSLVPARREMIVKKSQLGILEVELQSLITAREKKIEEIQTSMADIQANAQQEVEITASMFRALISSLDRSQAEVLEVVEMGRAAAELRSQALIRDLQLELTELRKRSSALSELSQSTDHINFFKTYPSLSTGPPMKSWAEVTLTPDPTAGVVLKNVTQMMEKLEEELRKLPQSCFHSAMESPVKQQPSLHSVMESPVKQQPRQWKLQDYTLDVTLDRESAHPRLVISEDCKQVYCSDRYRPVMDTPERFDRVVCVLGFQGFSSGRHYWEVHVGEKTDWDVGVVNRSSNRKGKISVSPANGYWLLSLRENHEYAFRSSPLMPIYLNPRPQRIGIYIDYEKGQVSFYNADTMTLIFSNVYFFTETLYPCFSPCTNKSGKNGNPLIIWPITSS